MDVHTKAQRSYNMSQVKSKNTKPELLMFELLKKSGISFEKHFSLYGKPDIAFPEQRVVVFIDGEFWHGKDFKLIKDNLPGFWVKKIGDNIKRDRRTCRRLRAEGWHVLHLWDKKVVRQPEQSLRRIIKFLEKTKISDGK